MLGNDIVDLEDPETQPRTFRPRFDERVFDPAERRSIARDDLPHSRRWAHWAAKEAAYKLAKQVDPQFVFSPSKLCAEFHTADWIAADVLERRGTLELPKAVAPGLRELEIRSHESHDRVHVIALPRGSDWDAVVDSVVEIEPGEDPSVAVRELARARIGRDLGIDANRIEIGRRGTAGDETSSKVPVIEIDGARTLLALSLSHHGRFVACAMSLRTDGMVTSASDLEEEPVASGGPTGGSSGTAFESAGPIA